MKLLTAAASNTKTAKNASMGNYLSYILHLAPAKLSGYNTCPAASAGCAAACLNTAGRGQFTSTQVARIKKTKRFFEARPEFMAQLYKDLQAVVRKASRQASMAVVRLNGTSDLPWESIRFANGQTAFEAFPSIQFYDYTKLVSKLARLKLSPVPNYHVTFSRAENNAENCKRAIALGFNVAVVFSYKDGQLPARFAGRPVVDGDTHDLRFLDLKPADGLGAVIALKAKGKARKDLSGFVKDLNKLTAAKCSLKVA